jgi:DNA-binding transcriptional ArsR family regulator
MAEYWQGNGRAACSGAKVETSYERLERMANALASPLRVRIMVALGARPMSPKMLKEELADHGYQARTIDKHLQALKGAGWVELAGTLKGGPRRGGTEHVYRAVRLLPILDDITWPALPIAMREMFTWRISEPLVKYLVDAWNAGTLEGDGDNRHCSCLSGSVDLLGWERTVAHTNSFFEFFLDAMQTAATRLADPGEQSIPVFVALGCFESPSDQSTSKTRDASPLEAEASAAKHPFSQRMAKVMSHPLRLRILHELSTRTMSPAMFLEEFGERELKGLENPIAQGDVYEAFRVLKTFDWLVRAETKRRCEGPGRPQELYRAIRPPVLGKHKWLALPDSMGRNATGQTLATWIDRLGEAASAGTIDARDDRHFTWTLTQLDKHTRDGIVRRMDRLLELVSRELQAAGKRLKESGARPIPITVALVAIESAVASIRTEPDLPFI